MTDTTTARPDDEFGHIEVSDQALEAAARKGASGAYTQFGLCTVSWCSGIKKVVPLTPQ